MKQRWFGYFGLPSILQSDNGLEFKNRLMIRTISSWSGDCKTIYGRPRHPQSQGLVEQANGTMERLIANSMEQHKTKQWTDLLPNIMYTMNTSTSSSTKCMPYEVTFNRKPNRGTNLKHFQELNEKV